ncbi:MAG: histidine kinase [Ignavibacteria bacterium RBG_13_36_8]|nr:MAG: histidine kinase [Ignavibacteria bacterium RBG_13_36_8]
MALFILAVIIFIIADIIIRYVVKRVQEKRRLKDREEALSVSLKLDFSKEAKTLKRAEIENPKAKILCVDDEPVILDSFRKILVLDGYSIDTVESGAESLSLVKSHHYDFVFTDLKMPEMDGVDVTKAVKHIRPDIDIIIITGYATVETAVECMKFGAMDYVQKPFTEDELLDFVKKSLIKRQDRIQKELKPRVHITHLAGAETFRSSEFAIPGGVFISEGHCWASLDQEGTIKIGIDDFAKKLIGRIDNIEFPNLGMQVKKGQPLYSIKQGRRTIPFKSPVSGKVSRINNEITEDLEALDFSPYEKNWICTIDADDLDTELKELKIGRSAVTLYQEDIDQCKEIQKKMTKETKNGKAGSLKEELCLGQFENLDDKDWEKIVELFFNR